MPRPRRSRRAIRSSCYNAPADPADAFEFGLARVIDGIVAYVEAPDVR
jgi:hypothetical protein